MGPGVRSRREPARVEPADSLTSQAPEAPHPNRPHTARLTSHTAQRGPSCHPLLTHRSCRLPRLPSPIPPHPAILPTVELAVFLDRDNTLIHNEGDLGDPDEVRLRDGVAAGLKSLAEAGYHLVVVTNQGGVARGKFTEDDVDAVHQRIAVLADEAADTSNLIDRFYYCPYHPEAEIEEYRRDHPWRKPHPGMLLQAASDMNLNLTHCWMIGDQQRDIEAGRAAGCRTILLTEDEALKEEAHPTVTVRSFSEAVQAVLDRQLPPLGPEWSDPESSHGHDSAQAGPGGPGHIPAAGDFENLRRAVQGLTEELRSERLRRAEYTGLRLAAGLCQLIAVLLALFGLLQLGSTDVFLKWMIGAILVQLLTVAILLLDLKG